MNPFPQTDSQREAYWKTFDRQRWGYLGFGHIIQQVKAKAAYQYLDSKGLVRPLKEACKTLARPWQDSKEKEKEKEQEEDQERDEEGNKEEDELTHSYDAEQKENNDKSVLMHRVNTLTVEYAIHIV